MELFKTNLLKQEYERFQNEVLINVLECGLYQKSSCEWIKNSLLVVLDVEKYGVNLVLVLILQKKVLENLDNEEKKYLENFIKDFLNLSNETLKEGFAVTKVTLPRIQSYNVKSYHKSEKCKSQVVYRNLDQCKKIEYTIKGRKRSYYKKF